MARTCTGSTSVARASVLAALVVLFAGCGGDAAAPERAAAIDRETFISTYVDLRTATIRAETDLITLAITKELFFRLISEFPDMAV